MCSHLSTTSWRHYIGLFDKFKSKEAKAKEAAMALYDANTMTNAEIAKQVGVSVATLGRWIAEHKASKG